MRSKKKKEHRDRDSRGATGVLLTVMLLLDLHLL